MNGRTLTAAVTLILLAFAGGYFLCSLPRGRTNEPDSERRGSPPPESKTADAPDLKRGRQLAQTYCATCHLVPEPQLLTKTEWAHQILPQMALWLGMEPVNYESLAEGRILQAARLYPSSPMLSENDWFAIWTYYLATAPSQPVPPVPKPGAEAGLKGFRVKKFNFHSGVPMTSLVKVDPVRKRIFVGDAYTGLLAVVDPMGRVLDTVRLADAPVSLALQPGGLYLTLIGSVFPSDALKGSTVFLPANAPLSPQPLLETLRRPVDTAVADLNQDGRDDLVVCSFGNRLGRFSWFENKGAGQYEEHLLLDRPGAIRAEVYDFDHDGRPDIIVQMAQAREGIYIFYNQGGGRFKQETVIEQHPLFGYTSFVLADFNHDGHVDLLTVNGDNGDNPAPHKNYHGLRLYLNDGNNRFQEKWFYPMEGAYKAVVADFDQDGDLDIAAIAYYPDFSRQPMESFVYLENDGNLHFTPHTLPEAASGRWLVMDAGDVDGDGDVDIVLGSFAAGPTTLPIPPGVRENWKTNGAAVMVLENLIR